MRDDTFKDFVLEQLSGLEALTCRRMFGGHGLYAGDQFFGIVHGGRLYFKADAATRVGYEAAGMKAFQPSPRQTLKNYLEVPASILEQRQALLDWARQAATVAAVGQ